LLWGVFAGLLFVNEYMKDDIFEVNWGERYKFMIDHRSYTHNLSGCEIYAWKIKRKSGLNGI